MQTKTKNQVYAGFFVRLAAYLIDWLVVGIALLVVRIPMWISSIVNPNNLLVRDFIFQYSVADIVVYVLTVTYFILPTYYAGRTLGKRLLQLKVISAEDRPMTFFEVAYRETVGKFLSGIIIGIGYLMVGIDKEKRGIHDLLADTRVIYFHEKKEPVQTPIVYQPVQRPIIYPENQKSYYQNAMMNQQNASGQQANPMASGQIQPENPAQNQQDMSGQQANPMMNGQNQPGNPAQNQQNVSGQQANPMASGQIQPENPAQNQQNVSGQQANPMMNGQDQPGNPAQNQQNVSGQQTNPMIHSQNNQNQPVHDTSHLMQQVIYEQPGFRQASKPVSKPQESSSRDSEI